MIILPLFLLLVISSNFAENSESFCRFCIALMESFKEQVEINPKFGQEQQESCKEIAKKYKLTITCDSEYMNEVLRKLKTMNAEKICENENLCKNGENFEENIEDRRGIPDFPFIPEVSKISPERMMQNDLIRKLIDIIEGKEDDRNAQNLTFHIDLKFKVPDRVNTG
ncbi:unnamed protein product [Dracunculus medinensis]|uniref:Saposin B-type domain-containing protein n=1 Tax=Dracunculus medinensis TaxID=318479 RepID=A0A0N4UMN7_DRAME|nr:unnamed protein product [Dracunculus medinensis]